MSEEKPNWGTTKAISVMKDAMAQAMAEESGDIANTKLPVKVVVGILCFAITNVLSIAGVYYDLRGDIRSIIETQAELTDVLTEKDLEAVTLEISHLKEELKEIEVNLDTPPTSLDHLRAIGSIRTDLKVLEQRMESLEREVGR